MVSEAKGAPAPEACAPFVFVTVATHLAILHTTDAARLPRVSGAAVQPPPVQQQGRARRGKAPEDAAVTQAEPPAGVGEDAPIAPPRQDQDSAVPLPEVAVTEALAAASEPAAVRHVVRCSCLCTHLMPPAATQAPEIAGSDVPLVEMTSGQNHVAVADTCAPCVAPEQTDIQLRHQEVRFATT